MRAGAGGTRAAGPWQHAPTGAEAAEGPPLGARRAAAAGSWGGEVGRRTLCTAGKDAAAGPADASLAILSATAAISRGLGHARVAAKPPLGDRQPDHPGPRERSGASPGGSRATIRAERARGLSWMSGGWLAAGVLEFAAGQTLVLLGGAAAEGARSLRVRRIVPTATCRSAAERVRQAQDERDALRRFGDAMEALLRRDGFAELPRVRQRLMPIPEPAPARRGTVARGALGRSRGRAGGGAGLLQGAARLRRQARGNSSPATPRRHGRRTKRNDMAAKPEAAAPSRRRGEPRGASRALPTL